MARFSIGIVRKPGDVHSRCFEEFAKGLVDALRILGHDVVPPDDAKPGRLILFGGAGGWMERIPGDAILYNAEQLVGRDEAFLARNYDVHRGRVVWDYASANVRALRDRGFGRVVHCPVGHVPSMENIQRAAVEDVDVLFYGSVNPRRKEILDGLASAGLKVVHLFGVYGAERDAWIARSKVVLNLHYYDRPIFEIFRVSHLLANGRCVVSEDGGCDVELEAFAERATRRCPRVEIVEACRELAEDGTLRAATAERGREEFRRLDLAASVRRALEESWE